MGFFVEAAGPGCPRSRAASIQAPSLVQPGRSGTRARKPPPSSVGRALVGAERWVVARMAGGRCCFTVYGVLRGFGRWWCSRVRKKGFSQRAPRTIKPRRTRSPVAPAVRLPGTACGRRRLGWVVPLSLGAMLGLGMPSRCKGFRGGPRPGARRQCNPRGQSEPWTGRAVRPGSFGGSSRCKGFCVGGKGPVRFGGRLGVASLRGGSIDHMPLGGAPFRSPEGRGRRRQSVRGARLAMVRSIPGPVVRANRRYGAEGCAWGAVTARFRR